MANKKISQLSGITSPSLTGVTAIVVSGTTYKTTLTTLREVLVDSGSHSFTGNQSISGSLTVTNGITGSLFGTSSVSITSIDGIGGTNYIFIRASGSYTENATELSSSYALAKSSTPNNSSLSSTNRMSLVVSPGYYDFSSDFNVDSEYIDIVSLTCERDIIFNGSGSINVTANDVYIRGIDVLSKPFVVSTNLNLLKIEKSKGGQYSFGSAGPDTEQNISGTYIDCEAGSFSFGEIASGTFIRCVAGDSSFGVSDSGGIASGYFEDCIGGNKSFGTGIASSLDNGVASGIFKNCVGGNYSFGYGANSEVYGETVASGVFDKCVAGFESFGWGYQGNGSLTGQIYYSRLTSGSFQPPIIDGKVLLSIDGSNQIINYTTPVPTRTPTPTPTPTITPTPTSTPIPCYRYIITNYYTSGVTVNYNNCAGVSELPLLITNGNFVDINCAQSGSISFVGNYCGLGETSNCVEVVVDACIGGE